MGVIVGIVIGIIVFFCSFVIIVFFLYKRKFKKLLVKEVFKYFLEVLMMFEVDLNLWVV